MLTSTPFHNFPFPFHLRTNAVLERLLLALQSIAEPLVIIKNRQFPDVNLQIPHTRRGPTVLSICREQDYATLAQIRRITRPFYVISSLATITIQTNHVRNSCRSNRRYTGNQFNEMFSKMIRISSTILTEAGIRIYKPIIAISKGQVRKFATICLARPRADFIGACCRARLPELAICLLNSEHGYSRMSLPGLVAHSLGSLI